MNLIGTVQPDEIYNLAGQSDVSSSFDSPYLAYQVNGAAVLSLLEAVRVNGLGSRTRFYQASTSEMYGTVDEPQSELSPFRPRSPYATSKLYAFWTVVNYRDAYGMFAVNGILFNHESPRRGDCFVTKKVVSGVARILGGHDHQILLGNLDARRDWGHAEDYVDAMWRMLQTDSPEDFVVATGIQYSVRDFVSKVFECASLPISWSGHGLEEIAVFNNRVVVRVTQQLMRPADVPSLRGCADKAHRILGWSPSITVDEMIHEMLAHEIESLKTSRTLPNCPFLYP
jgi:GDPmannose 4,6-dehydratase